VGVFHGISQGVFEIDRWTQLPSSGKWEFTGKSFTENHELADANWFAIIEAAKGYWQYGQYLIVEFDGKGRFRLIRGGKNKTWQSL
jgi:hypothetical protein